MMDPGNIYEKALSCHAERRLSVLSAPSFQAPSRRRSGSVYSDDVAGMLLDPCYSGVGSGGSTFLALEKPYLALQQDVTRKLMLISVSSSSSSPSSSSSSSSYFPPPPPHPPPPPPHPYPPPPPVCGLGCSDFIINALFYVTTSLAQLES